MTNNYKAVVSMFATFRIVVTALIIVSSWSVSGQESAQVTASSKSIKRATIVFGADLPLINDQEAGDYAELATLLESYRKQSENTFFLFGGRSIGPSPMAVFDRGSHIIDILNTLEPDAYSIANREFSYFEDELSLRSFEAAFPMVASNLIQTTTGKNLDGLVNSALIQKGNVRLGVISVLNETVVEEYRLSRIRIEDSVKAIKETAEKLRQENVDVVVLFYPHASEFIEDLYRENVIDISLSADLNVNLLEESLVFEHENDIFLDEAGEVAVIELAIDHSQQQAKPVSLKWNSVYLKDIEPNAEVAKQVSGYSNRLNRLLGQELGLLTTPLDTMRLSVRTKENAFGNFIVDAVRRYADTDVSLINGGVIRGSKKYSPNTTLTRRDIAIELPFRSRVVVIEVSGEQIWRAVENGLSEIEQVKGRFPHVSGMTITYNSMKSPGSRVESIDVNGQPIDLIEFYSVATTDYLAQGGDSYNSLKVNRSSNQRKSVIPLVSDIVINEILVSGSIAPRVEKRLIDLSVSN